MSKQAEHPVTMGPAEPVNGERKRLVALGVVASILVVAALGLHATVAAMQLTFKKESVPLRSPLTSIPRDLGPWVQVNVDERMEPEIEDALGTKEYIQRVYVDTRKADSEVLEEWTTATERTSSLRDKMYRSVVSNDPLASVTLHVAYYTGGVDTVPHIPDRCMVAGGYDPVGSERATLAIGEEPIDTSFVQFQQRAGHARPTTLSVAYFFHVNGDYEWDPITGVRKRLQNLFETRAYFAKIECMTASTEGDADAAQAAIAAFLTDALPAIETSLPAWNAPEPWSEAAVAAR